MSTICIRHICDWFWLLILDGDRGTPSRSVDTQRNRILATAALKEAESLADQGKYRYLETLLRYLLLSNVTMQVNFRMPKRF